MKPAILWKGMRLTVMPVYRLTASSIISSFRVSGKRHLLLTGGRGTGKTTLLRALVPLLCPGAQEITTAAYPADRVEIRESVGGKIAVIGRFDPALPPGENRMRPWRTAFAAGSTRPAPHGGRGERMGGAG
ncbi:MAG: ATP-binding cassette domain-containing protein [Subdoligranulum sp.]